MAPDFEIQATEFSGLRGLEQEADGLQRYRCLVPLRRVEEAGQSWDRGGMTELANPMKRGNASGLAADFATVQRIEEILALGCERPSIHAAIVCSVQWRDASSLLPVRPVRMIRPRAKIPTQYPSACWDSTFSRPSAEGASPCSRHEWAHHGE